MSPPPPADLLPGLPAGKLRAFAAVNVSLPTVKRLAEEIDALRPVAHAVGLRVRWVPPANLHVTLKFLGWVREELVEGLRDRLRVAAAAHAAFDLEIRGLGAFPDPGHPRVIWAGVKPSPVLNTLEAAVEREAEALGIPR